METIIYNVLDSNEFDELVNKHISEVKNKYEIVTFDECYNYTCKDFNNMNGEVNDYDKEKIKNGKFNFVSDSLLNMLISKGVLQKGNYLIKIYW